VKPSNSFWSFSGYLGIARFEDVSCELRQRIGALAMTKEQPKLVAVGRHFAMGLKEKRQ
jgi:hypothetical protein